MENQEINQKILKIWEDFPEVSGENSPLLYPGFEPSKTLFIGLNPSLSEKAFKTIFKGTKYEGKFNFKEFFEKKNINKYLDVYIEGEKLAKEKYSYFNKFKSIDPDFQHIDLFLYRLTSQKEFKDRIGLCKKGNQIISDNFGDFGLKQLELASEIIQLIKPRVIVVANAFASDIICHYSKLFKIKINEKEFNEKGYDVLVVGDKEIPIFFSSMLTQQRALDNHTFRRLKREVKIFLEGNK